MIVKKVTRRYLNSDMTGMYKLHDKKSISHYKSYPTHNYYALNIQYHCFNVNFVNGDFDV